VVVAVVPIASVEAPSVVLLIDTDVGLRAHVGVLVGLEGPDVIAQVRPTVPENPLPGVTTMPDVLPAETPATTLTAGPLIVKLPTALPEVTAKLIVLVSFTELLVPVRVTAYAPAVVDAVVVNINWDSATGSPEN
jgi:hypothetical protein